jgi:hypothetical protein
MEQETEDNKRGLFDHVKQIRGEKHPDYYNILSEQERAEFDQYMILRALSMDPDCLDYLSSFAKYLELIPNDKFYRVCCDLTPGPRQYFKWIKSTKTFYDSDLLDYVSSYYKVSRREAIDYCDLLVKLDKKSELAKILDSYGLTEKEKQKLLK